MHMANTRHREEKKKHTHILRRATTESPIASAVSANTFNRDKKKPKAYTYKMKLVCMRHRTRSLIAILSLSLSFPLSNCNRQPIATVSLTLVLFYFIFCIHSQLFLYLSIAFRIDLWLPVQLTALQNALTLANCLAKEISFANQTIIVSFQIG